MPSVPEEAQYLDRDGNEVPPFFVWANEEWVVTQVHGEAGEGPGDMRRGLKAVNKADIDSRSYGMCEGCFNPIREKDHPTIENYDVVPRHWHQGCLDHAMGKL